MRNEQNRAKPEGFARMAQWMNFKSAEPKGSHSRDSLRNPPWRQAVQADIDQLADSVAKMKVKQPMRTATKPLERHDDSAEYGEDPYEEADADYYGKPEELYADDYDDNFVAADDKNWWTPYLPKKPAERFSDQELRAMGCPYTAEDPRHKKWLADHGY